MDTENSLDELKECFLLLDDIVPIIDKIGSGFEDTEESALALLLYFKSEKVLNKLSKIRKIIDAEIESKLTVDSYDEFIEQEIISWKPPYNKNKKELLALIANC
jgi:hypothetical protein